MPNFTGDAETTDISERRVDGAQDTTIPRLMSSVPSENSF